jgi:hypothetical protein
MGKPSRVICLAVLALALSTAAVHAQVQPKPEPTKPVPNLASTLLVENEGGQKARFTAADLAKLKRVTVTANDHGTNAVFEGYALVDVLKLAGVEFGETLRGKRLPSYLLVEAADKYRAVYSLAEIDPGFTDKAIVLADKRDGRPLPDNARDWQIVVPDEKRAGRWVRQVVSLKILAAP